MKSYRKEQEVKNCDGFHMNGLTFLLHFPYEMPGHASKLSSSVSRASSVNLPKDTFYTFSESAFHTYNYILSDVTVGLTLILPITMQALREQEGGLEHHSVTQFLMS